MHQREPRVYVTNFSGHDYSSAEVYGLLTPITVGYVSYGSLDRLKAMIANGIKDSEEGDWLCLSGMSFLAVVAAVMWYEKHGQIRMLKWDERGRSSKSNQYRPVIMKKENNEMLLKLLEDGNGEGGDPQERGVEHR